jgi:colicin import membrane protein
MDQILFAIGKLTKGLAGISEKEYAERKEQSDQRKKDRAEERALRKTNNDELTKAQITGLKKDEAQFKEKKLTHDRLTTGAKKEAEAKEAAVKAQEKLLDYSAGPEELLKQFSGKQGGAVEIGIKKQEIGKEKDAANKELTEAKTTAEKKAAIEKVEAAEKKLEALTKAEKAQKEAEKQQIIKDFEKSGNEKADAEAKEKAAVPAPAKPQPTTAPTDKPAVPASAKPQPTTQTDAGKKALEADAEKKKQEADAKAKTDAEAKAKEEAAAKEKQEQDKKSQESPSTLLAELNTKMAQLIKLQAQTTTNTYENVMATKGLNKNLYKA